MAAQTNHQVSHEIVARAFVQQYYYILSTCPQLLYRFYKDSSMLSWPQPDGELKSVTTTAKINECIMSSHFKDCKVEVATINYQDSAAGGVLVVVTAWLIGQDDSRKSFSQTFHLAPLDNGFYVLNDILRFSATEESSTVAAAAKDDKNADENASIVAVGKDDEWTLVSSSAL